MVFLSGDWGGGRVFIGGVVGDSGVKSITSTGFFNRRNPLRFLRVGELRLVNLEKILRRRRLQVQMESLIEEMTMEEAFTTLFNGVFLLR